MDRSQAGDGPGGYAWYVVWLLLAVSILSYVDRLILSFLVEPIKANLHLKDAQIGMVTGLAFAVLYVIAGLPLGRLMDRASRPVVLALCVVVWSIGTAASGLAGGFLALFLARVAVGVGEAGLSPAAISLIGDYFGKWRVEKPLGVFTTGLYLGGGAALIGGGELFAHLSHRPAVVLPGLGVMAPWRAVFLIMGVPGLILAALTALSIREPRASPAAKAVVSLSETLAFGRRNARLLLLAIAAVTAWGFNGYGLLNWYPAMLQRTYHIGPHAVAWTYGPAFLIGGALGSISTSPAVAWMSRRGHANPLFAVAVWTLVAMTVSTVAGPLMPNLPLAILFAFLTLLFSSATVTAIYSLITLIVPGPLRGVYTAAYMAIMNITGGAFGSVIVGVLTDRWLGAAHLDYAMAIMAVVFGPLSVLLMALASRAYRRSPPAAAGPTPVDAHVVLDGTPPLAIK